MTPAATDVEEEDDLPPLEPVPEVCAVCMEEVELLVLDCQHSFCEPCLEQQLAAGSSGSRMTFGYLNCGVCRAPLGHRALEAPLARHRRLRERALDVAEARFRKEKLHLRTLPTPEPSALRAQAEAEMAVYRCSSCSALFCSGRARCAADLAEEEGGSGGSSVLCKRCEWPKLAGRRCDAHGSEYAIMKCDFCCSLAVWRCGGGNHYCDECHSGGSRMGSPCPGPGRCPLGVEHPANILSGAPRPAGTSSFVVGCMACMGLKEYKHEVRELYDAYSELDPEEEEETTDPLELEDVVLRRAWREDAREKERSKKEARQRELLRRGRRVVTKPQQPPRGRRGGRR